MDETFRVGTRGSPLALAQTEEVLARLRAANPHARFERVTIRTHGDEGYREDLGATLDGKRAFTRRIDDALLHDQIDFAVHSLKDVPTSPVPGLTLAAVPPRADPRDVLVRPNHSGGPRAPYGRIGTSSLRRRAQLLAQWPDALVEDLRGNVGTRLRRLDAHEYDAIVVAAAGLLRLGLRERISEPLSPDIMTPAPGQGALAVQARTKDDRILRLLSAIDDPTARRTTEAERRLAALVGGDCNVPFGALASVDGGRLALEAVVASPDGRRIVRARGEGDATDPSRAVGTTWEELKIRGAETILQEAG